MSCVSQVSLRECFVKKNCRKKNKEKKKIIERRIQRDRGVREERIRLLLRRDIVYICARFFTCTRACVHAWLYVVRARRCVMLVSTVRIRTSARDWRAEGRSVRELSVAAAGSFVSAAISLTPSCGGWRHYRWVSNFTVIRTSWCTNFCYVYRYCCY